MNVSLTSHLARRSYSRKALVDLLKESSTVRNTSMDGRKYFRICSEHSLICSICSDGLAEMDKRHPELDVDTEDSEAYPTLQFIDKPGVEVALEIINSEAPRSLSYIILGPLTTFAQLVRQHGDVVRNRIGQVVSMGGNLDVPGNTSAVAECMRMMYFTSD